MPLLAEPLTESILAAIFEVANLLGAGFLEAVYRRALLHELTARGLRARTEAPFPVTYKGALVGSYFADILVEDQIILELKCVDRLCPEHYAQCLNYLKASGIPLALLINFQRHKVEWKRVIRNH